MRKQLLEDNELVIIPIRELEDTKRTTSLIHADSAALSPSVRLWINELAARFPTKKDSSL
jgi:hypothetical protein